MINKTLGTGGDYSNWVNLQAALQGQTLADDWTITQISNITLSAGTLSSLNLNGHTLRITNGAPHNGDPTAGFRTLVASDSDRILITCNFLSGVAQFDNLHFYMTANNPFAALQISTASSANTTTVKLRDCLFVGVGSGIGNGAILNSAFTYKVWNCVFFNANYNSGGGKTGSANENITCIGGAFNYAGTVKNCYATSFGGSSNQSYNASENTSAAGTGSITNQVRASTFYSTLPSSALFCKLIPSSASGNAGAVVTIAENTAGIRGNPRPHGASYSIGADEVAAPVGVEIGSVSYRFRPWPSFSITPAIQWVQDSAGYWNGSDRGASQDAYEATVVFHGRETDINTLEQSLDANREAITLSNLSAPIFAPNVDHTGSIQAVVLGYSRRQLQWGAPYATHQIYELEVRFRAIAPTLLATTPSWASLRLQDGFRAEHSHESPKAFTYAQTAVYGDHRSDVGTFEASFSQTTAGIQAILAYLLGTARASAVAFPATVATTVPYPWGRARGTPTNCKALSFECSRKNLNRWALSLKLVEAP